MEDMDSPAEEAGETPQEEENEPSVHTPVSLIGGVFVGAHSDHHQSMFNHKEHHKKKNGY